MADRVQTTRVQFQPLISCPAQILVIDRESGAAEILMDTISRLLDQDITVTLVSDQQEALQQIECCYFDMVAIGLERDRPDNIALVPYLRENRPGLPVIIVGHQIHHRSRDRAYEFGADEVITLPQRAQELKTLVGKIATHYLEPIEY